MTEPQQESFRSESPRCAVCGKKLNPAAEDYGQTVLCRACGTPNLLPALAPPDDPAPMQPSPASGEKASSGDRAVGWVAGVAAVVLLGLAAGLVAVVLRHGRATTGGAQEPLHAQVRAMRSEAERLAIDGRYREAYDKYQALCDLVGERLADDSHLAEQIEQVRRDQQRIFRILTDPARLSLPATAPSAEPARNAPPLPATSTAATRTAQPPATRVVREPPDVPLEPPVRRRPAVRPLREARGGPTDEQIGRSIQRGADYLISQFRDGMLPGATRSRTAYQSGLNALCVYALLQCGQSIRDERLDIRNAFMKTLIEKMKQSPMETDKATYARGLRATALALYARPEDRPALWADVRWLLKANRDGTYGYNDRDAPHWDNSNGQYGVLGVWSGAEVGIEVPNSYWAAVQKHWEDTQAEDGQWGYQGPNRGGTRLSMTVAGIATLFVAHEYLDMVKFGTQVGREPFSPALAKSLRWLEAGNNAVDLGGAWWGYTLYGLERVGLASGFKYFGDHDWYRVLAAEVIAQQNPDGSWGDLVNTSYSLLFLARGRHPILMNKLRFDGYWANRPRDLANLARYAGRELERPLNWQVVSIDRPWQDWTDSPILYLASHKTPQLAKGALENLRAFVLAGGMLFTHADGPAGGQFNAFAEDLAAALFPGNEMVDVPLDHPVYTAHYPIEPASRPKLRMVSNGSRILMLHSPTDIAQHWQMRREKTQAAIYQFGINLFVTAAGKGDLRNRLDSRYLAEPAEPPEAFLRVARLRYAGMWDPEPYAWVRFPRWFQRQTGLGVRPVVVDLGDLSIATAPLAHLAGTMKYTLTDAEAAALRRYVEDGGVLLIESCGGADAFAESVLTDFLPRALGASRFLPLSTDHPLLRGSGDGMVDLSRPRLRPYAQARLGAGVGGLYTLKLGRGRVIFSGLDLSTGLLGTDTWPILGYHPDYAQALMRNLVLWVWDGAGDASNGT